MKGPYYERSLALANDDPDILDRVHEILMKDGLSESSYAQVFALLFYDGRNPDERISCSSVEKIWKRGDHTLSDVKLFSALNQCCDLIHAYVLYSWEQCVLSAWAPRKEVIKAETEMDSMEALAHARNIIGMAAALMPGQACDTRISWNTSGGDESDDGS